MDISFLGYVCIFIVLALLLLSIAPRILHRSSKAKAATPRRIHLKNTETLDWLDKEKVEHARQEFTKHGYVEVGSFIVPEMPGLNLLAFMKVDSGLIAIVYEKAGLGVWFDLVLYCKDGTSLTLATMGKGAELRHRPGHDKIRFKGAGPSELFKVIEEKLQVLSPAKLECSKEEFVRRFEKAYAEELDWRNSTGGVSEEELRAVAKSNAQTVSDEAFAELAQTYKLRAASQLLESFGEKYCEKNSLSAEQWINLNPKILFVYDNLPLDLLKERLSKFNVVIADDLEKARSSAGLRADFQSALSRSRFSQTVKKIDEFDYMLSVDVYKSA